MRQQVKQAGSKHARPFGTQRRRSGASESTEESTEPSPTPHNDLAETQRVFRVRRPLLMIVGDHDGLEAAVQTHVARHDDAAKYKWVRRQCGASRPTTRTPFFIACLAARLGGRRGATCCRDTGAAYDGASQTARARHGRWEPWFEVGVGGGLSVPAAG